MFVKELTNGECLEILTEKRLGRLASARENQPYIVPIHFVFDGQNILYAFSTLGQKIEWMRANPLVCVEVDDIDNQSDWTSLIIFGRYEELPNTFEYEGERNHAHELLSCHPMWWQPAFAVGTHRSRKANEEPIYFRIHIETISGHRAISAESGDTPVSEN